MSHDELLATISHNLNNEVWLHNLGESLRAVVELHKPLPKIIDEPLWCGGCYPHAMNDYPCKTIQAIEMELSA